MKTKIKNKIKGMMALCLVAMMTISMGATVFAAGETPTTPKTYLITINNDNTGHEYGAYQIFEGDLSKDRTTLSNIQWGSSVLSVAGGNNALLTAIWNITEFDGCGDAAAVAEVLAKQSADSEVAQQFAKVVGNWLEDNNVTATKSATAPEGGEYVISGLEAGYYLVKDDKALTAEGSDTATRYILKVVKNVEGIKPKSETPTVEKKVLEDTDITDTLGKYTGIEDVNNYNDVADWDIGEIKNFMISAKLPATIWDYETYDITFHDTCDKGITLLPKGCGEIQYFYYVDGDETKHEISNPYGEKRNFNESASGAGDKLDITCEDEDILDNIREHAEDKAVEIVVIYDAKLGADAVVGLGGNKNSVYLEYSNNPYVIGDRGKTEKDEVVVFTFELEGTKVDGADDTKKLEGAQFILGKDFNNETEVPTKWAKFDKNVAGENIFTGWTSNESEAGQLESVATTGEFSIKGLDTDTYYLKEIAAPDGYNLLNELVKIKVEAVHVPTGEETRTEIYNQDGDITGADDKVVVTLGEEKLADQTDDKAKVTIANKKGSVLPSTGDTGSLFFYAFGAIGAALCIIVLITKRRMNKYDNK